MTAYSTITLTPDINTRPTFITGRWIAGGTEIPVDHSALGSTVGDIPDNVTAADLERLRRAMVEAPEGSPLEILAIDSLVTNEPKRRAMRISLAGGRIMSPIGPRRRSLADFVALAG